MTRPPFASPPEPMTRRTWLAFAAILALAAALRLYGLAAQSIWYDEGSTIALRKLALQPWLFFNYDHVSDPPLLPLVLAPVAAAAQQLHDLWLRDWLVRLVPALFGVGTVAACFALGRRLLRGNHAALVAAFLAAISPFHVYYAQEARAYSLHGLLALLMILAADRALESNRPRDWLVLLLAELLTLYSHYFAVWTIFGLNLYMLATLRRHWPRLRGWVAVHAAVVALFLPALRLMLLYDRDTQQTDNWYPPLRWRDGLVTLKSFVAGYAPEPWLYWPLFVVAVVTAAAGIWALRRRLGLLALLGFAGFLPLAANLVIWKSRAFSYYQHRFFIVTSFALYFLMAAGITMWPRAARTRRWLTAATLLAVTGLTAPALSGYYAGDLHPAPQHRLGVRVKAANRPVAARVRALGGPGDRVAHYSHKTWMPMRHYYLDGGGFDVAVSGMNPGDFERLMESLQVTEIYEYWDARLYPFDQLASGYDRLWYVVGWWEPDEEPIQSWLIGRWYDYHGARIDTFAARGVQLFGYAMRLPGGAARPVPFVLDTGPIALPATAPPAVLTDGRTLAPRGASLALEGDAVVVTAGETPPVPLTLTTVRTAALLPAMAFRRAEDEPKWFAVPAAWHEAPGRFPNRWDATLAPGERTEPLTARLPLASGRQRVFVRVFQRGPARAHEAVRMHARVDAGLAAAPAAEGAFETIGNEDAWVWREACVFDSPGGPAPVRLWAEHVPGSPSGRAELSVVAFVPEGLAPETVEETFTLAPGEQRRFRLALPPTAALPRVDVMLTAPAGALHRHVSLDAFQDSPEDPPGGPRN